MNPTKKTKIIFSPSNVDEYERQFIIEHQIAMGYMSPIIPRTQNVVELMNQAYPVPSPLHASFRRWIDHQQAARFDCFKPPSWQCTCYKCVTYQLQSEKDIRYFEQMKDENELRDQHLNVAGMMAVDRITLFEGGSPFDTGPGSLSENNLMLFENIKDAKEEDELVGDTRGLDTVDRLQMLCDVVARAAANAIPANPTIAAVEDVNVTVRNVCHFFTEMNFDGPEAPSTPKLTTIQFLPESDLGKEAAQRAWIRRMRMTPVKLHF